MSASRFLSAGCQRKKKCARPSPRLAKIHMVYSVREIAILFGVHANSVFAWISSGLKTIDDGRPSLVHGSDLREFLERKRYSKASSLANGEFRCMRCRTNRRPSGDMVDLQLLTNDLGNLVGMCPVCDSIMNRRVNILKVEAICEGLEISVRKGIGT